jgi:hypothetical protein
MKMHAATKRRVSRYGPILLMTAIVAFTVGRGIMAHTVEQEPRALVGVAACAVSVAASVVACVPAHPLCPVGGAVAACNCIPIMIDEFEGMTCP